MGHGRRNLLMLGLGVACLAVPAGAHAGPLPETALEPGITTSRTALARVSAPSSPSEKSIEQAVEAARRVAVSRALNEARRAARLAAPAAGLSLGAITAVADSDATPYGPAGVRPGGFCRPASKTRPKPCRTPDFVSASSTVTFAITPAPADTSRASVTGLGQSSITVTPRHPRNNRSIRNAVEAARRAAIPKAIAEAKESAAAEARAAGLTLGGVISIAENPGVPYGVDFAPFGPGRYCGVVRQPVFETTPGSPRRKIVGFERSRRCFVPRQASASFYIKFSTA
jgi:uncharacterized protein YggE